MVKLFVWDFHGVLEKDNEKAVIDISNRVLAQAGYKERFSQKENENYYGLKWYQYFERLLPQLSHKQHLALQAACFKYAEQNLDILAKHIKPNDHVFEVLTKIAASGHQQIVLSNSRQSDLIWFINSIGIAAFFDAEHIVGVNAHQKHKTKADAFKNFLNARKFDQIVIIGDSEDDMKLKKLAKSTTYFYKHPHRNHQNNQYVDYVIKDLREILREL